MVLHHRPVQSVQSVPLFHLDVQPGYFEIGPSIPRHSSSLAHDGHHDLTARRRIARTCRAQDDEYDAFRASRTRKSPEAVCLGNYHLVSFLHSRDEIGVVYCANSFEVNRGGGRTRLAHSSRRRRTATPTRGGPPTAPASSALQHCNPRIARPQRV